MSESTTEGRSERALDGEGEKFKVPLEKGRLEGGLSIGWDLNLNV